MINIHREITPLTAADCFMIFSRTKKGFDFPLHSHEEFELNFIQNGGGAKRIIGDHVGVIENIELALVGSNLSHGWFNHLNHEGEIKEITIQFHKDLFDDRLLGRNQLSFLRRMFENACKGILFSQVTALQLQERIIGLNQLSGLHSVLELAAILNELSLSSDMRVLSGSAAEDEAPPLDSRRMETVFQYMRQHFQEEISLAEISKLVNMTETSFSRFIRKRTGKTFVDSLNDIRIGRASRLLIDTKQNISEIAYKCGFGNLSNFNRIFHKKKGFTPSAFRANFTGSKTFI